MIAARILVLIPHPDDEVVGCATAIARARAAGAVVSGLYLTSGVPARARYAERVARRRQEAERAAAVLGLSPAAFTNWPSRTLKSHLDEAHALIEQTVAERRIDEIWVPAWEGGHQDHDVTNFLASHVRDTLRVREFAEYNFAGGRIRSQTFVEVNGTEEIVTLSADEARNKRNLLAIYRSERTNLRYVRIHHESLRKLAPYDYRVAPHSGRLFCERFRWIPFRHPSIDFEPSETVRAALAAWRPSVVPMR